MNNRNCFDFLRFFFAANILLAHLGELSQNKNLEFLSSFPTSSFAVKGFFIISGFLVAKSFANTSSLKEYFIKRAKRILPAYIVVLLLAVLILSLFSSNSFSEYFTDIGTYKYLGWNSVFLNFMHPCLPGLFEDNLFCAVNGSLWTLKVEEGFYIVLPLIFYAIKKSKKPLLILVSLYVLSILYWFVMDFYLNKPLLAKQLPGYLAYFVTGIFLFLNFDFVQQEKNKFLMAAILLLIISNFLDFQMDFLYPAAFGTIVIITAYSLPFLNNFGKYGDFTYGLYIYHFPIIQLFRQYDLFEKYDPILMAFLVISITFFFAVFSWFFVEKRFLDRFKKDEVKQTLAVC
ncbi:Peptidoglycan/LPS O-acetylase OafA/YrhL, contains acyltransferase and SGNH-hydrolase domains [Flavobacterium fluvii]|uniref:Peptidoglycan/LPS O-acetylase OafA/YrhL, contains acyltransferase and SGNH-hydrolase domains n=1 Tax=Flavobacterium fluvii TaxID=468056 RepID=A0A1M5EKP3_9FLAO|nr:acyltransferase [Flavobacterium fluvii]SHF79785.1 Peptidoglycan/LPS O-acetylase OafA/YrhL, contains acyltransferase and SGNH-hydrolase domains [Flavobacterium fluvii]